MKIISVNTNGKLEIFGLNVISRKLEDGKEYQIKLDIMRSEKDGVTVKNVRFGEKASK